MSLRSLSPALPAQGVGLSRPASPQRVLEAELEPEPAIAPGGVSWPVSQYLHSGYQECLQL